MCDELCECGRGGGSAGLSIRQNCTVRVRHGPWLRGDALDPHIEGGIHAHRGQALGEVAGLRDDMARRSRYGAEFFTASEYIPVLVYEFLVYDQR